MPTRIQIRRGLESEWTSENPVLAEGELGAEVDTGKFKIGNGTDPWNDLPYGGAGGIESFSDAAERDIEIPDPEHGDFVFLRGSNTTQFYDGVDWQILNAARGGGGDKVFFENELAVNNNYTITSGKNAVSAGPIVVSSGVTVTVPSNSNWVIV